MNAVRLHVTAADALVRHGVDGATSDNRRYARMRCARRSQPGGPVRANLT